MAKETPGIDRLDHGGEESKNPTKRVGRERPSIEKRTYTSPVGKPCPKAGQGVRPRAPDQRPWPRRRPRRGDHPRRFSQRGLNVDALQELTEVERIARSIVGPGLEYGTGGKGAPTDQECAAASRASSPTQPSSTRSVARTR